MPFQTENKPDTEMLTRGNLHSISYAKFSQAAEVKEKASETVKDFAKPGAPEGAVKC